MIILPTLVIGFTLGLLVLLIWGIYRKRIPKLETGIQIVVSVIASVSGFSYILIGIMNFLNSYLDFVPMVEISIQEALGVIMFSGLVFLLVGLDQLKKYLKRKK